MSGWNITHRLNKKDIIANGSFLAWTMAIVCYFFQFPFARLAAFMVPFLFIYIFLQLPQAKVLKDKKYFIFVVAFLVYLLFSVIRSLVIGIEFQRVVRFAVILFFIPLSFCIKDSNFERKKEVFINLAIAKALILILFGLIIAYFEDFSWFRGWCQQYELGDIYFLNRFFPKVQVKGNLLILVAFILDFLSKKKLTVKNIVLLLGVLFAGNFAYILGLILFAVWYSSHKVINIIKTNKKTRFIVLGLVGIAFIAISIYVAIKFKEKSAVSNVVRLEQALILLKANPLIGDGLGAWVTAQTENLSYNGEMYFELQTLYIFKQIGVVGLGLFYTVTLMPILAKSKTSVIVYLIYLFVSFWNPYCFDSTQMITILLLMNVSNIGRLGETNDKGSYYSLFPYRFGKGQHT